MPNFVATIVENEMQTFMAMLIKQSLRHSYVINATLKSLINGEAIIRGEGGKSFKINKRGDPNKRVNWNIWYLPTIKQAIFINF